jgi:oxygen-independent coproporphyrinogen-3 oxidase
MTLPMAVTERDLELLRQFDGSGVDEASMRELVGTGFTRVSLGVQDFDPAVHHAVNRVQPTALTVRAVDAARQEKARLQVLAIRKLTGAGYRYIGMDHFALPEDELSRALDDGTLHRDFQGYSTRPLRDLVGLGASAIGKVGDCCVQNHKSPAPYRAALEAGRLPVLRGVRQTRDDEIRGHVIQQLMCQGCVDRADVANRFRIRFDQYFASEMQEVRHLGAAGLAQVEGDRIHLTCAGRLLMRRVASVFDAYAPAATRFSLTAAVPAARAS